MFKGFLKALICLFAINYSYSDGLSSSELMGLQATFGSKPFSVGGVQSNPIYDFTTQIEAAQYAEQQNQEALQNQYYYQQKKGQISKQLATRYVFVGDLDDETQVFLDKNAIKQSNKGFVVQLFFKKIKPAESIRVRTIILTEEKLFCFDANNSCNDLSKFKEYASDSIIGDVAYLSSKY